MRVNRTTATTPMVIPTMAPMDIELDVVPAVEVKDVGAASFDDAVAADDGVDEEEVGIADADIDEDVAVGVALSDHVCGAAAESKLYVASKEESMDTGRKSSVFTRVW